MQPEEPNRAGSTTGGAAAPAPNDSHIARPAASAKARRANYRVPLTLPMRVRGESNGRETVEITESKDISYGGTYFLSAQGFTQGTVLSVVIPYNPEAELVETEATVMRLIPEPAGKVGVGIQFADIMLVNALLGESLQKHIRISDTLLKVMKAVGSELGLDALLHKLVGETSQAMEAERTTLFLVDRKKNELWSKVAEGAAEIRLPMGKGISGHVAATGEIVNIADAYADARFNRSFDDKTGFRTRTILCMPIFNDRGEIIGVTQILNKSEGVFTRDDEDLLDALNSQMAILLEKALLGDSLQKQIRTSDILLKVMKSVGTELSLDALLIKVVAKTSEVMDAERSTLFLVDRKTNQLWSKVAEGAAEIRLPMGKGISGHVAVSGDTVNIPDAYADARFNQSFDQKSGFRTRTILCMPIKNDKGQIIGVTQVLNKRGGIFTRDDEELLEALNAQVAVSLENAALFEEVRYMKNYNEGILTSIATGVITLGDDGQVVTLNPAASLIFGLEAVETVGKNYIEVLGQSGNTGIVNLVIDAYMDRAAHKAYDVKYVKPNSDTVSVHLNVLPLLDPAGQSLGMVIVSQDITQEQRLMGTLCRYVTREIAEQIMAHRDEIKLGGARTKVTVLFSDIRNFTTMSEQATEPEEIVNLLNAYFGRMIRVIFNHEGTLDKFIGDAIMAVFGAPVAHTDDPLRAVLAARDMRRELHKFNEDRRAQGLASIDIGVGICNGEAICGNIGSEQRMEYTVIGDTVNLASRLEGLTKDKPCKILINDKVYEEVKDQVPCVHLGQVHVKGKEKGIELYGVPDPED